MRAIDRGADPAGWARELGISTAAVELYLDCEVIDLHVDSFIWQRVFGYDLTREHAAFSRGTCLSQVDFPRIRAAAIGAATWVITTNPLRDGLDRARTFERNVSELLATFERAGDEFAIVRDHAEFSAARSAGKHAAFIGVQGGNAFDADLSVLDRLPPGLLLRITVMHLTPSALGFPSGPRKAWMRGGLTPRGVEFVRKLNEARVFVDLAHASPRTFWEAASVHDPSLPLIVTHTGACGVHRHWRNLEDDQIRRVADSGGTIGVIYHSQYLGDRLWGGRLESIVLHLEHVIRASSEDHASLGSDWDGAIVLPRDMQSCLELPRLVECMLRRGWSEERVRKVLGHNFLRALRQLRG